MDHPSSPLLHSGSKRAPTHPEERPRGFCWCGCGQRTKLAVITQRDRGDIKGQPVRYIIGHYGRRHGPEYVEEDRGYSTPCWMWQHGKNDQGYAQVQRGGKAVYAHRFYYEREHGPIPEGMELDHLCRVHGCVNPGHVEPVSHAENMRRSARTKLTAGRVREIRRLAATGLSHREIARRFGVDNSHVSKIVLRKCWNWSP